MTDYLSRFKKDPSTRDRLQEVMEHADFYIDKTKALMDNLNNVMSLKIGDILSVYDANNNRVVSDETSYPAMYLVAGVSPNGCPIICEILPRNKLSVPSSIINELMDDLDQDCALSYRLDNQYMDQLLLTGESIDPFAFYRGQLAKWREIDKVNKSRLLKFPNTERGMLAAIKRTLTPGVRVWLDPLDDDDYGRAVKPFQIEIDENRYYSDGDFRSVHYHTVNDHVDYRYGVDELSLYDLYLGHVVLYHTEPQSY